MMIEDGVLGVILSEASQVDSLNQPDVLLGPILRLAALINVDRDGARVVGERLRLSNADRNRLVGLAKPLPLDPDGDPKAQRLALYRLGPERYRDLLRLATADGRIALRRLKELLDFAESWPIPIFPLSGDDVTALAIPPGPRVGQLLAQVKRWWEDGDFTADRAACLAKLKEVASPT